MGYRQPRAEHAAILVRQDDGSQWSPDVVVKIQLSPGWTITDHPVEDGVSVSDHIERQPQAMTITCVVTENPVRAGGVTGGPAYVREKMAWLRETADARQLVDIVTTKLGTFTSYAIQNFPHAIDNVARLQFDLALREVVVATSDTISLDTLAPDVAAGAAPETNSGEQATRQALTSAALITASLSAADVAAQDTGQSYLAAFADWLGS